MLPAPGTGHISIPVRVGSIQGQHDFQKLSLSNACEIEGGFVLPLLYTAQECCIVST